MKHYISTTQKGISPAEERLQRLCQQPEEDVRQRRRAGWHLIRVAAISLATAALFSSVSCKVRSQASCLSNLREIDGAKTMLASAQGLTNGTAISKDQLLPYLRSWPTCPSGGSYSIGKIGESPKCSYQAHRQYEVPRD